MTARRHHYLPRFYLAGFTVEGTEDGTMFVVEPDSGRTWRTTPNGAAHERDYYRVEGPEVEPDAFEGELSRIEARAAKVIREVAASLVTPTGEALADLIAFVAFMTARTPPILDHWKRQEEQVLRMAAEISIGHPQAFEGIKARARTQGRSVDHLTQEQLLHALDSTQIRFTSTWNVEQLLLLAETVFPLLMGRLWSLAVPAPGAGVFICSDMPAVVHDPTPVPAWIGPSFVARVSEFTMPLNRRLMLVGRFDRQSATQLVADARNVAIWNGRAIRYARRLYCPHEDFTWEKNDLSIGNRAELLAACARSHDGRCRGGR